MYVKVIQTYLVIIWIDHLPVKLHELEITSYNKLLMYTFLADEEI